jgi:hypothetical protein
VFKVLKLLKICLLLTWQKKTKKSEPLTETDNYAKEYIFNTELLVTAVEIFCTIGQYL